MANKKNKNNATRLQAIDNADAYMEKANAGYNAQQKADTYQATADNSLRLEEHNNSMKPQRRIDKLNNANARNNVANESIHVRRNEAMAKSSRESTAQAIAQRSGAIVPSAGAPELKPVTPEERALGITPETRRNQQMSRGNLAVSGVVTDEFGRIAGRGLSDIKQQSIDRKKIKVMAGKDPNKFVAEERGGGVILRKLDDKEQAYNFEQRMVAKRAGEGITGGTSEEGYQPQNLLTGPNVFPDDIMNGGQKHVNSATKAYYNHATQTFSDNLMKKFTEKGTAFESIEDVEEFVTEVDGYSHEIGAFARAKTEEILQRMNPKIYKDLIDGRELSQAQEKNYESWKENNPDGTHDDFIHSEPQLFRNQATGKMEYRNPKEYTPQELQERSSESVDKQIVTAQSNDPSRKWEKIWDPRKNEYYMEDGGEREKTDEEKMIELDTQNQAFAHQTKMLNDQLDPSVQSGRFVNAYGPDAKLTRQYVETNPYAHLGDSTWANLGSEKNEELLSKWDTMENGESDVDVDNDESDRGGEIKKGELVLAGPDRRALYQRARDEKKRKGYVVKKGSEESELNKFLDEFKAGTANVEKMTFLKDKGFISEEEFINLTVTKK